MAVRVAVPLTADVCTMQAWVRNNAEAKKYMNSRPTVPWSSGRSQSPWPEHGQLQLCAWPCFGAQQSEVWCQ